MKRFFMLLALVAVWAVSCQEKEPQPADATPPASYLELLAAYDAGKVFALAEQASGSCKVTFSDGSSVSVPASDFAIDDCTSSTPSVVTSNGSWWVVDGIVKPIKVDSGLTNDKAWPVYVYYDSKTLHMYLSNRQVLSFWSLVLEEEKQKEEQEAAEEAARLEELARQQNLPVVRITTVGGAEIVDKKNYVDGTITVSDPGKLYSDVETFTADMGIRGRGNSTWGWPKKPWKVKLDEKASILGMPKDKEWCLLANYADRTLMRNIVAMKLSEICGFSWTPRLCSVEVYLNDVYQGVYTFCEHKKVASARVNIEVIDENVTEGEALTGGYYFEIEEQQDADVCWWTSMGVPMMFSEPETPNEAQQAYAKGLFADFEAALQGSSFADPEKGYAAYIDVESFINFYIVQELTKNIDGNVRKSSFLTKEVGGKLEMYHLWDFDLTLGNCGYFDWRIGNGPEGFWVKDYASDSTLGGGWYHRLFEDPAFVDAVQKRWDELMPQLQEVAQFIEDQAYILGPAQKRNFSKWSIMESVDWVMFPSLGSYEAEVEYLKEFYTERLQWLDTELHKL